MAGRVCIPIANADGATAAYAGLSNLSTAVLQNAEIRGCTAPDTARTAGPGAFSRAMRAWLSEPRAPS